jgi:GNAT superfamily N-acetyltransferase
MAPVTTRPWRITSDARDPAAVERLLGLLPTWFGIPASNAGYIESARQLPTYLAWGGDPAGQGPVGVLLTRRHFPEAAEIHLLAVHPGLHRRGVGRALVDALEADLTADGCELLQVKTLGPSKPDAGYALTASSMPAWGSGPWKSRWTCGGRRTPA